MKTQPSAIVRARNQLPALPDFIYPLRIGAISAIVLMNTATYAFDAFEVASCGWYTLNVFNALARWAVPLFVMIAGALMLDPAENTGLKPLFRNHLLRLGLIYGCWSLVYALTVPGGVPDSFAALLEQTLRGPKHFWYIPMLAGLYLITPVIKPFACRAGKRDLEYFLLLCFVFGYGFGLLKALAILPPLTEAADALKLPFVFGYTGFYVFGHYSRIYPLTPRARQGLYVSAVIGLLLTVWGTTVLSLTAGQTEYALYANLTPQYAVIAAAVYTWFFTRGATRADKKSSPLLRRVAGCSFGIYILHWFAYRVFDTVGTAFEAGVFWRVPAAAIGIYGVCLALSLVLSHIPGVNKYLV